MKFISTAGHGYLQITPNQLKVAMRKGFEPTSYSMFSKSQVLLEEDCDAGGYMKAMIPNDDDRVAKWKAIKSVHQNNISRKYMATPPTLSQFEDMLKIFDVRNFSLGMIMTTCDGEQHEIIGSQSNGYIYSDGQKWNMPFYRITKIAEKEVA